MSSKLGARSRIAKWIAPLLVVMLLATACNQGMPGQAGEYQLQANSLTFNGSQYEFAWVDQGGTIHWARGDDVQLVQDTRAYLEIRDGKPIVHLNPEEPVTVRREDQGGSYNSSWFPFLAGAAIGNMLGGRDRTVVVNQPYQGSSQIPTNQPGYRYPPTDSFTRGDSLHGSVTNDRPSTPDYRKVQPIPDAISSQSGGTGGGSAATNKQPSVSSGQAGGAGTGSAATSKGSVPASGQSGGTGVGSAATNKGAGAGSGATAPKVAPSGGKSSGGFSGGKSSGGFSGGRSGKR